jgi:hypothetical protein
MNKNAGFCGVGVGGRSRLEAAEVNYLRQAAGYWQPDINCSTNI